MNPNKQNDVSWRLIEFSIGRVNPINMKNIMTLKVLKLMKNSMRVILISIFYFLTLSSR